MGKDNNPTDRRSVLKKAAAFAGGSLAVVAGGSDSASAATAPQDPIQGTPEPGSGPRRLTVKDDWVEQEQGQEYVYAKVHNPSGKYVHRGKVTVYFEGDDGGIFNYRSRHIYDLSSGMTKWTRVRSYPGRVDHQVNAVPDPRKWPWQ